MALRPDYAGANYGGNPQVWQGPKASYQDNNGNWQNWGGLNGNGNGTPPPATQGGSPKGYVWWDRNWVPYDPAKHQGMPVFQYPVNVPDGSTPYYANDVSSALMQQAFPGAAAGYAFGSSYLEPRRQQNIVDMLNMQTQGGARNAADAYQKAVTQGAYGQARQAAAGLYGPGGGGKQFQASNLLASQNRANEAAAGYRAQVTDPMQIAIRRQQVIEGGYNNPLGEQVRGFIPGLEPQRQNNNFWSQLAGVGSQILPYVNLGGSKSSSGGGTGSNTSTDTGGSKWW